MPPTILFIGRCNAVFNKIFPSSVTGVIADNHVDFGVACREHSPDLVVIDSALGLGRNCEISRALRKKTGFIRIIVTNYPSETDEIRALDAGADAYLSTSGDYQLLCARLAALIRMTTAYSGAKTSSVPDNRAVIIGNLSINLATASATIAGSTLPLTAMEYKILKLFMNSIDRTFSRQQIIELICDDEFDGFDRTIDSHIKNLRKKLADAAPGQSYIKTIYGLGYKIGQPTKI
ncbi:MAG: response regulator transcription factor [Bacillota bacterium]